MRKSGLFALVAAGILGSAGVAAAQGAPPPGAAPQASVGVSAAPPALQWGAAPGADAAAPEKKDAPPLRWRGTTFTWNQAATTTAVGVGRDNIGGEDEFYGWEFNLRPNFYLVDQPKDKLKISADIGWNVELTNGDTVEQRELLFNDTLLKLGYSRTLFESSGADKGEYRTSAGLGGGLRFPTSKASNNQGQYLGTTLSVNASQVIKILGTKADGLNNLTVSANGSWGHLFSRSYTPTNSELQRPRQNATGETFLSDQLGRTSFALNTLSVGGGLSLPLYGELTLATDLAIQAKLKHDFENGAGSGCDVTISNQPCVEAGRLEDRTLYQPATAFGVSLAYPVYSVLDLTIGYQNTTRWIGEDGQRRNVLYSPEAQFYLDITANLDAIYSKASGREKKATAAQAARRSDWY